MATQIEGPVGTFTAGAAIALNLRVVLSAGLLAVAGDTDRELGTQDKKSFASGDVTAVRLRTAEGTVVMVADGAISQGDDVFTAAGGKISATQGAGSLVGVALEAAGADEDWIEVLRD